MLRLEIEEFEGQPASTEVLRGLRAYGLAYTADPRRRGLRFYLRDPEHRLRAGLLAFTHWDWLSVQALWVEEALRGSGHGSALLERAEEIARARGCRAAQLDAFSAGAAIFYEKRGYLTLVPPIPGLPARAPAYRYKRL